MYITAHQPCKCVMKITPTSTFFCRKPASVILVRTPNADPIALCPECARKLAGEILDSMPGGRLDYSKLKTPPAEPLEKIDPAPVEDGTSSPEAPRDERHVRMELLASKLAALTAPDPEHSQDTRHD